MAPESCLALSSRWQRRFDQLNLIGQLGATAFGTVIAYVNYRIYIDESVGYWIAAKGALLPIGYIYIFCIFGFYWVIFLLVLRSIAISLFLRDVVRYSTLSLLPLHPDRSGGLRPIGELGLKNQYLLSILGLNLVVLVGVSMHYLEIPDGLWGLIAAAAIGYLIFGPLVFVAPLLAFRSGMLAAKTTLMADVASRLRQELLRLHRQLKSGPIQKNDEELIDRLRKIGSVIDDLPVWPFDTGTLRKFFTAYVIPIASSIGLSGVKVGLEFLKRHLA